MAAATQDEKTSKDNLLKLFSFELRRKLACYSQYVAAMSRARPIHPGTTYLITRRTERRHCLLRPDSQLNRLIRYALIVSARRHDILLHAFCAMSTHLHYVVTDTLGKLPRFLEMFHRLVAIGVKFLRKWDGAVWNRTQTSVVELCTRQAIVEKIAYTLANPVQAGLVWNAQKWPGVRTLVTDIGRNKIVARRPKECFDSNNPQWDPNVELKVSVPPSIDARDIDNFRADVKSELAELVKAVHERIPISAVLGRKRVMKVSPESRITSHEAARQLNPTFAVGRGNPDAAARAKKALQDFHTEYRKALDAWREGNRSVEFPAGTYAMRVLHGVSVR
jgi:putative transposase